MIDWNLFVDLLRETTTKPGKSTSVSTGLLRQKFPERCKNKRIAVRYGLELRKNQIFDQKNDPKLTLFAASLTQIL